MPKSLTIPDFPAELAEVIALHREMGRGWVMEVKEGEPTDGEKPKGDETKGADADKGDGPAGDDDKALGSNGAKALAAERDARKDADKKLAALERRWAKLAEAFGVTPDENQDSDAAKVAALAEQVKALQHTNTVERVAREHGITDADDLTLLREQPSEQAMEKLAKRIQPKKTDSDDGAKPKLRRAPAPDPSQGRGDGGKGAPQSVAQVIADRRAAREAKSKN